MTRERTRPEGRTARRGGDGPREGASPIESPAVELPGRIYAVPDALWGFRVPRVTDHPGLVLAAYEPDGSALLLKGTDAAHRRDPYQDHVLEPDGENGLSKPTAFHLVPRVLRLRRILLLHPERMLGRVSEAVLDEIRGRLLHPLDPGEGH